MRVGNPRIGLSTVVIAVMCCSGCGEGREKHQALLAALSSPYVQAIADDLPVSGHADQLVILMATDKSGRKTVGPRQDLGGDAELYREIVVVDAKGGLHSFAGEKKRRMVLLVLPGASTADMLRDLVERHVEPNDLCVHLLVRLLPGVGPPSGLDAPPVDSEEPLKFGWLSCALQMRRAAGPQDVRIEVKTPDYGGVEFTVDGAIIGSRVEALRTKLFLLRRQQADSKLMLDVGSDVSWNALAQTINSAYMLGFGDFRVQVTYPDNRSVVLFGKEPPAPQ